MDTIMNYIDSMFSGIPENDATRRLRDDITANMTDKYEELVSDGKSENEAVGTVISEFGNIDEVLSEMGISRTAKAKKTASPVRVFVKRNIVSLIARPAAPVALMILLYRLIDDWYWEFRFGINKTSIALIIICFAAYSIYALLRKAGKEKASVLLTDEDMERLKAHQAKNKKISELVGTAGAIVLAVTIVLSVTGVQIIWYPAGSQLFARIIILFMGFMVFMRNYHDCLDIYMGREPGQFTVFKCTVRFSIYWLTIAGLYNIRAINMLDGDPRFELFMYQFLPVTLLITLAAVFVSYVADSFIKFGKR